MYLEWYRVQQMSRRDLNDDESAGGTSADVRFMPSGPISKRAEGITVHRRLSGDPRGNPQTEASHPKQFPQGIPGRVMKSVENGATSKRASEGSEALPLAGASGSYELLRCQGNKAARQNNLSRESSVVPIPRPLRPPNGQVILASLLSSCFVNLEVVRERPGG